jgi:zinc protease
MLFNALREEEGLVYSSGAGNVLAVDPGYFIFYAATTEKNLKKVENVLLKVIENVKNGNISDKDIASSKRRLLTNHAYSLEKNSSISMIMTLDELYGLGYNDYANFPEQLQAVTKADIIQVANEILDLEKYATVIIHSEK